MPIPIPIKAWKVIRHRLQGTRRYQRKCFSTSLLSFYAVERIAAKLNSVSFLTNRAIAAKIVVVDFATVRVSALPLLQKLPFVITRALRILYCSKWAVPHSQ